MTTVSKGHNIVILCDDALLVDCPVLLFSVDCVDGAGLAELEAADIDEDRIYLTVLQNLSLEVAIAYGLLRFVV